MLGTHRAGRSRQARYGYAMISKFAPSITVSWVIRCAAWGHANTLHHFMSMFLSAQTESRQFSHGESYRKQLHPAYTIRVNGTRHNRSDFFFLSPWLWPKKDIGTSTDALHASADNHLLCAPQWPDSLPAYKVPCGPTATGCPRFIDQQTSRRPDARRTTHMRQVMFDS